MFGRDINHNLCAKYLGTGLVAASFSTTSNDAVGTPHLTLSLPSYTAFDAITGYTLSDDNVINLVEGVENGVDVIQAFKNDSSAATATFQLSSAGDHFEKAQVLDGPSTQDTHGTGKR